MANDVKHDRESHKYKNGCLPSVMPEKFISKAQLNSISDKISSIIYNSPSTVTEVHLFNTTLK